MTGVIEGSGGTGVLEGHRPGTGVEGGGAGPVVEFIGGDASDTFFQTSNPWVTSAFTALPEPATYLAAVSTGYNVSSQQLGEDAVTGMGTSWTRIAVRGYFNSASSGQIEVFKSEPGILASDGPLTVTKISGELVVVSAVVVAVRGKLRALTASTGFSATNPLTLAVPGAPLPPVQSVVSFASDNHAGFPSGTVDPDLDELGRSGPATYQSQALETYAVWSPGGDATPADISFSSSVPAAGMGMINITLASGFPTYNSLLVGGDANAHYPLESLGVAPAPPAYDVEILDGHAVNALYPLESAATGQPGDPITYDTTVASVGFDTTTYVPASSKGVGSDPDQYNSVVADPALTTYIEPGPKGVGADPADYDTELATMDRLRYYPGDSLDAAAAIPDYDTTISGKDQLRYYPGDELVTQLTTPPTVTTVYHEFGSSTVQNLNWGSATPNPNDGDTIVGAVSEVGLIAAPDGRDYAVADGDFTWLGPIASATPIASRTWFAKAYRKQWSTGDTDDTVTGMTSNQLKMATIISCDGVGDPTSVALLAEAFLPGGAGITYDEPSNLVTFPTLLIPVGWRYFFGVHQWDGNNTVVSPQWVNATELLDEGTTLLNDGRIYLAEVVGDGLSHDVECNVGTSTIGVGGGYAYILAVPGT